MGASPTGAVPRRATAHGGGHRHAGSVRRVCPVRSSRPFGAPWPSEGRHADRQVSWLTGHRPVRAAFSAPTTGPMACGTRARRLQLQGQPGFTRSLLIPGQGEPVARRALAGRDGRVNRPRRARGGGGPDQNSTPACAFTPARNGCFTCVISVTRSAAATSASGALRPVTTRCFIGARAVATATTSSTGR